MIFFLNISNECNLHCSHCNFPGKTNQIVLDVDKFIGYLNKALVFYGDQKNQFIFHGGEPLMVSKQNVVKILKYFKRRKNIEFSVQTNFTLMDSEWVEIFNKYKVSVGSSYDFNLQREIPLKNYEKYLRQINDFRGFCVTLTKKTTKKQIASLYQEFLTYIKILNKGRLINFNFQPCIYNGVPAQKKLRLTPVKYLEIVKYIEKIQKKFKLSPNPVITHNWGVSQKSPGETCPVSSHCFYRVAVVTPEGQIYTCPFLTGTPDNYLYDLEKDLLNYSFLKKAQDNYLLDKGCLYSNLTLNKDEYYQLLKKHKGQL